MAGVIAADEAGIGLLAQRAGEHLAVENGSFAFIDAVLGVTKADSRKPGEYSGGPEAFHGIFGHLSVVHHDDQPGRSGRNGVHCAAKTRG
jgi:hypothetical protein